MKLLISADIHGRQNALAKLKEKAKKEGAELIIVAGDLSVFERELDSVLLGLDGIGVPVLIVPGNHEDADTLRESAERYDNVIFLHEATYKVGDYVFVGYGNPGFMQKEPQMELFFAKIKNAVFGKRIILVTHGPPYGTKLDYLEGEHVGCKSINKFIEENDDVLLAVSGHLHENFGIEDRIKKTKVINPGPMGKIIEI